jgi:amidase
LKPRNGSSSPSSRRQFLQSTVMGGVAVAFSPALAQAQGEQTPAPQVPSFELDELTVRDLQRDMSSGKFSAQSLTEKYLARIDAIDKRTINSIIEVNPDALATAEQLDRERKAKGPRGPLHGIPVLIKDNIGTHDRMMTTAGSLALLGSIPPRDAFVAQKLRQAGAVILGKTNLSEWANFRSTHSTSGWSGRGRQTNNPYALNRNPCGSSSGSGAAVSANLCALAIGTETDGSIVCPANANGVAGIKPTVGLVSRAGIIPISHTQDTAGPMARTLADAAALLGALTGVDPNDPATAASSGKAVSDYTRFLDRKGLRGARLGVVRKAFGFDPAVDRIMEEALAEMKRQGATLVDPADIPTWGKWHKQENEIMLYEFKADLNSYLAGLGPQAPVHTLQDVINFNDAHAKEEMPYFGQELFVQAQAKGPLTSKEYRDDLEQALRLTRKEGIDAIMDQHKLDALVAPTGGPAWLTDLVDGDSFGGGSSSAAAVAGYPDITVPVGFIFGLPLGISFFGRAWSEPALIRIAYAFEQATKARKPPRFLPTVDLTV